jgi:Phage integrase, N-terminal/Integrase
MHQLVYEVKQLAYRCREGSYATQANRKDMLLLFARQLVESGYRQLHITELKGRHINALLSLWRTQGLSHATIRNRLAVCRWLLEKVGKRGVMPPTNARYDLEPRQLVAQTSKAKQLPEDKWQRIPDPCIQMSLRLQQHYGLRREESIKIRPWQADEGYQIRLQGSWCKGGKERTQPLVWPEQRTVLDAAKALVKHQAASLIPAHLTYVQQLKRYEDAVRRVGLSKLHGLRHGYFQQRYAQLTGFPCVVCGGPTWDAMTPEQRLADTDAQTIIATEMGHDRIEINYAYLGR